MILFDWSEKINNQQNSPFALQTTSPALLRRKRQCRLRHLPVWAAEPKDELPIRVFDSSAKNGGVRRKMENKPAHNTWGLDF